MMLLSGVVLSVLEVSLPAFVAAPPGRLGRARRDLAAYSRAGAPALRKPVGRSVTDREKAAAAGRWRFLPGSRVFSADDSGLVLLPLPLRSEPGCLPAASTLIPDRNGVGARRIFRLSRGSFVLVLCVAALGPKRASRLRAWGSHSFTPQMQRVCSGAAGYCKR